MRNRWRLRTLAAASMALAALALGACQTGYGDCPPGSQCWEELKASQRAFGQD